jgi:hypothetical protein
MDIHIHQAHLKAFVGQRNGKDTGYGRIEKAKTISADNPARYFPASDEQIGGPFSAEKYRTWFASLDSAV